ncbi:MAG: M61 family peptidase [Anaeromyxobacter sp.]
MHRPSPRSLALAAALLLPAAAGGAGPVELLVDATDAPRGLLHARMEADVAPGPLTLAYPKWIQGEHAPSGPIEQVVRFEVSAGGKPLPWRRDPADPFLFQVEVPPGVKRIAAELDYASPPEPSGLGYGSGPNMTRHLVVVDWHDVIVYPRGARADALPVLPRLRLPPGWRHDSALPLEPGPGGVLRAPAVPLETLLDSPVLAGDRVRTETIAAAPRLAQVTIASDRPEGLEVPASHLAALGALVKEADLLFGARHHRSFRWLYALGAGFEEDGLEHHESTDLRGPPDLFTDPSAYAAEGWTAVHEYVHAWNGKYRRPAGLVAADPNAPLDAELLWVYEGLTRYLDLVLSARSGLRTPEASRDYLAWRAGGQDRARPGRAWRSIADTARSAAMLYGSPKAWRSVRRNADFYDEMGLVWLEADARIREATGGRRSLDDFCRAFFGGQDGPPEVRPYVREDVEAALAKVAPLDWRAFFEARVYAPTRTAPLEGLALAGWRLVYDARPNPIHAANDAFGSQLDHTLGIGLLLDDKGAVQDVVAGSAAWKGGVGPGMKLVAVNGQRFAPETFAGALEASARAGRDVALVVEERGEVLSLEVPWRGGAVHAHLERDPSRPDLLGAILAPRATPGR